MGSDEIYSVFGKDDYTIDLEASDTKRCTLQLPITRMSHSEAASP
jgi:hypothetical protein